MLEIESFGEVESLHQGKKLLGVLPPYMTVRCNAVDGLLIDSGLYCFQKAVGDFAQKRGIQQAVITHHHEDHSGNAGFLRDQGVHVSTSKSSSDPIGGGFSRHLYQRIVWSACPQVQLPSVKQKVETDKYTFEVIEAPGHCEDQIALYEPRMGWLFTGDAFLSSRIKYFRGDENFQQTIATLQKLAQLPFERLFCAHHPVAQGGQLALKNKLQYLLEIQNRVRELHAEGLDLTEITRRVMGKENKILFAISLGDLSKRNLVRSILFGPKKRY